MKGQAPGSALALGASDKSSSAGRKKGMQEEGGQRLRAKGNQEEGIWSKVPGLVL